MKSDQYHLCKIAEESAEVAQRALKAQQFGLGETQPGQPHDNLERLVMEFHDLAVTFKNFIDLIGCKANLLPDTAFRADRLKKMDKFLSLSIDLGQVDENTFLGSQQND